MKDKEVFWLGHRAGTGEQRRSIADEPEFADAMKNACQHHGGKVQRFIAAKGVYGTWLIEFERGGENQRIVWNGKDEKMVLQVELARGGWQEPSEVSIEVMDVAGFADGIRRLIGHSDDQDE